jgi:hypothetical protein
MKYDKGIKGTISIEALRRLVGEDYVFLDGAATLRGTGQHCALDISPGKPLDVIGVRESPELGTSLQDPVHDIICRPHDADRNVHDYSFFSVDINGEPKPRFLSVTTPTYMELLLTRHTRPTGNNQEGVFGLVVNRIDPVLVRKAIRESNSLGFLEYFLQKS